MISSLQRQISLRFQTATPSLINNAPYLCVDASCPPGAPPPAGRRLVGGGDLHPGPGPEPAVDQARLERGVSEAPGTRIIHR